ncbi:hypothetical protein U1Q18_031167 [Sarracenia purpurea var. burkii]
MSLLCMSLPKFFYTRVQSFFVQVFARLATELPVLCSTLLLCKPLLLNAFDLLLSCCAESLFMLLCPSLGLVASPYAMWISCLRFSYLTMAGVLVLPWVCCSIHGCAAVSMVSKLWLEVFVQWVFCSVFVLLEVFVLQALVALSWSSQFNPSYVFGLLSF